MTFDVSQLPGRASQLKQKAIDVSVEMLTRAASSAGGVPPVGTYQDLAEKQFADVDKIYDDFVGIPSPDDFKLRIDNLATAMGKFATTGYTKDPVGGSDLVGTANTNLADVTTSGGYLEDWTGDAADTYNKNYAAKFVPVTSNLFTLTSVIRNGVEAEAAIWATVRDDLDKLSNDALKKMDECLDKSPSDWNMLLTVAAAVVSIAAVPITGGGSAELAIAAVGAGISLTSAGISAAGDGKPEDISGDLETGSPDKIVASLGTALNKVRSYIVDHELTVTNQMNSAGNTVILNRDAFCLPRPALADAPDHKYNDPHYAGQDA